MARDNQDLTKGPLARKIFFFQCTTYCIESFAGAF